SWRCPAGRTRGGGGSRARSCLRGPRDPIRPYPRRPPRRGSHRQLSGSPGCSEWLLTGTTTDGDRIEVRGCDLFEFRDDKIVRKDSYWKLVEG
ncbi:MAG: nuclear transport factor 2 family protein, partial [Actinobacteria bacterium]|nr:nuclear transport factor 2 family protein [Actinomycetota bacterium]